MYRPRGGSRFAKSCGQALTIVSVDLNQEFWRGYFA